MRSNKFFPLKLGFIGGGDGLIGKVHANGARLSGLWTETAASLSSKPAKSLKYGRAWGIADDRIYSDYRDMAKAESQRSDGIDAVAIATPNHLHYDMARAFLQAGIDVICDKPVTVTTKEANALLALQKRTGLVFAVTYPYAFHPMALQARAMVRRGMLGKLRQIHVEYLQEWALHLPQKNKPLPWRLDKRFTNSFTIAEIGTHARHLADFIGGEPLRKISAMVSVAGTEKKQLEDTAYMHARWGKQAEIVGSIVVSQAFAGTHCGLRIRLAGTKAGLDWEQENPEFLRFHPINGATQVISRGVGAGMLPEVEAFLRMPRGHPEALTDAWANLYGQIAWAVAARRYGFKPPTKALYPSLADGRDGVQLVEAALKSAAKGAWVNV